MSHTIHYDPTDHILSLNLYGQEDSEGILALVNDLSQISKQTQCERVVTDIREVDLNISMMDIYNVIGRSVAVARQLGVDIYRVRHAVIAHDHQTMPRYYETIAQEFGHPAKVFHDLEDAKAWLKA